MKPNLSDIINHCRRFSENIVLQMPKNTNIKNFIKITNLCNICPLIKIEKILVNGRSSQLFIYLGSPSFTNMNPLVFKQIFKDSKMNKGEPGCNKK